ncbi:MAG TPA: DHH family phosphoesterase [Candidatus Saccharimonadales bacterium]|nr:DHH family phosphoesterase [Candidatus Saccharimonadales bacterium]
MSQLLELILAGRGLTSQKTRQDFLKPDYAGSKHDPFRLPDMQAAVDRLVKARQSQEKVTIYGDYDIDGLTATTLLMDALSNFGFTAVDAFIPDRFREGYGLTVEAVERIAAAGANLIITVDCGSLSHKEIERAGELGVDVIVTDHHNVAEVQPSAVAVINPKRLLAEYPEAYENFLLRSAPAAISSSQQLAKAKAFAEEMPSASTPAPDRHSSSDTRKFKDAKFPMAESQVPSEKSRTVAVSANVGSDFELTPARVGREEGAPSWPRPGWEVPQATGPANSEAALQRNAANDAKRRFADELYPFVDLAGVGVAFKLVQALQTRLDGLPDGHEKWLLDLVALGTVCDVVTLADENRANVFWGLNVMRKTRRPGLKALMAVARVEPEKLDARALGFGLGPRLNAAGRLETARLSLDLLTATKPSEALKLAQSLDDMNQARRAEQDEIFKSACRQAETRAKDPVLIVSDPDWNHGIIGIVAAKLLEKYHKPTFVLQELDDGSAKGSARSFGDFSAADAIKATKELVIKGGGHKLAAGVTLKTANIDKWRQAVNQYYKDLRLDAQLKFLEPATDASLGDLAIYTVEEIDSLGCLEPFGNGNLSPVIEISPLTVTERRTMGTDNQHVKYSFKDQQGNKVSLVAFGAADKFQDGIGETVRIWAEPSVNEWRGIKKPEGRLLKMEII